MGLAAVESSVPTTNNHVEGLSSVERDVSQHRDGATGKLQHAVHSVKAEDISSIYKQLVQYDAKEHQETLLEISNGYLTVKPAFAAQADDASTEQVLRGPQGNITHKEWTHGAHTGEREDAFENGTKVHYLPEKNGESVAMTRPDGTWSIDRLRADGKGGVIDECTESNPQESYRAYHAADGSLTVAWKDGRRLERSVEPDGTARTKMTGPNPWDNFTATESSDLTQRQIRYADGSSYEKSGDQEATRGIDGKAEDATNDTRSASDFHASTCLMLSFAFWENRSQAVDDVRRMRSGG